MAIILSLLLLIPASLYALFPSFQLGLYGDDWLEIWRFIYATKVAELGLWGYFLGLFTRYGSFDLIMGILLNSFGFQSFYFYLTAFLLRMVAVLSFYPLISYLTKSKFAAFLGMLYFAVTAVGLDATNWVFNMPVYLAIAFLNLFFYFLIKSKFEKKDKYFLFSLGFFALAILTAAVRMTGLIPLLISLYFFWLLRNPNLVFLKQISKQISAILLVFILIVLLGNSFSSLQAEGSYLVGSVKNWTDIWGGGLTSALLMINQGRLEFISYPFLMIGNMVFPIELTEANKLYLTVSGLGLLISGLMLLKINWKKDLIATGIFLSVTWMVFSFIFGWVRSPDVIFPFTHRYFIVSAMGLAIFFSLLINSLNKFFKILVLGFFAAIIILNIFSSRKYLTGLVENSHGAKVSEKIWSQIPYVPEIGKTKQPLIFYFEGEERGIMHGVITFGFPYHMGVLYKQDDYYQMPLPMDEWKSLISSVTDGKSLVPYGHPEKPLPLENIYAFRLEGKDKLVDITTEIRAKLLPLK